LGFSQKAKNYFLAFEANFGKKPKSRFWLFLTKPCKQNPKSNFWYQTQKVENPKAKI
jgi:hypothetical protein